MSDIKSKLIDKILESHPNNQELVEHFNIDLDTLIEQAVIDLLKSYDVEQLLEEL